MVDNIKKHNWNKLELTLQQPQQENFDRNTKQHSHDKIKCLKN